MLYDSTIQICFICNGNRLYETTIQAYMLCVYTIKTDISCEFTIQTGMFYKPAIQSVWACNTNGYVVWAYHIYILYEPA